MLNQSRPSTQQQARTSQPPRQTGAPSDQMGRFVSAVLGENEDVWSEVLPAQKNIQFQAPKLVLFNGVTRSGCGTAQSANQGPHAVPLANMNDLVAQDCLLLGWIKVRIEVARQEDDWPYHAGDECAWDLGRRHKSNSARSLSLALVMKQVVESALPEQGG
jgi:hypothetical protein